MAVAIEDDELWKRNQERIAPDVAVRFVTPPGGGVEVMRQDYLGIDGLREGWRAWLEPWDRFELQIDEALDVGDGRVLVLVLVRTLARLRESTTEVPDRAASAKARLASSGSRNSSVRIGTPSRKVLSIAIWTSVAAPLPLPASLTTVRIPRSRARPKPVSRSA